MSMGTYCWIELHKADFMKPFETFSVENLRTTRTVIRSAREGCSNQ